LYKIQGKEVKFWKVLSIKIPINQGSYSSQTQEALGRTIHLLSFDTTWTAQKTMLPTIFCCCRKIVTEPLPSNERMDGFY
jgi:hypothetical protein